jgi:hypothetical protein
MKQQPCSISTNINVYYSGITTDNINTLVPTSTPYLAIDRSNLCLYEISLTGKRLIFNPKCCSPYLFYSITSQRLLLINSEKCPTYIATDNILYNLTDKCYYRFKFVEECVCDSKIQASTQLPEPEFCLSEIKTVYRNFYTGRAVIIINPTTGTFNLRVPIPHGVNLTLDPTTSVNITAVSPNVPVLPTDDVTVTYTYNITDSQYPTDNGDNFIAQYSYVQNGITYVVQHIITYTVD